MFLDKLHPLRYWGARTPPNRWISWQVYETAWIGVTEALTIFPQTLLTLKISTPHPLLSPLATRTTKAWLCYIMTIRWLLLRSNKASNFAFLDRSHIQRPCSYYWSRKDPPCVHFLLDLASSWPNVQLVTPTLIPSQAISRSFCTAQRCTITQPSLKHTETHYSPQITTHTAAFFKAALHCTAQCAVWTVT